MSSRILKTVFILPIALKYFIQGGFDIGLFATGLNPGLGRLFRIFGGVRNIEFAPNPPEFTTDLECNIALACRFNPNINKNDTFFPLNRNSMSEANKVSKQYNIPFGGTKIVAIYPSKELRHRPRWNLENLVRTVEIIKLRGFNGKFVVVGSQSEGEEWEAIDKENIVDANFAGKLSISGSAALLSKCSLTIGNDGGLMHVAGAVGSPLVTIMANAPLSYRPPGESVKIIQSKVSCCDGMFPNRPKDCTVAKCTEAITVQEVYEACSERLTEIEY
jgi:ADP-heptose:LPS heptosyltransferase